MSVSKAVREHIEALIEKRRKRRDERLPSERELAAGLHTSRATVAKALAELAREGLVERRHGSGTFIADPIRGAGLSFAVGLGHIIHKSASHFNALISSLSRHAADLGVSLQIIEGVADQFRENPADNRIIRSIEAGIINGMLVISRMSMDVLGALWRAAPLVLINNSAGSADVPAVFADPYRCGFVAADYLIRLGHTRIAYARVHMAHWMAQRHLSGMRTAFEAHALAFPDRLVFETKSNNSVFTRRVGRFLSRRRPTACIVHDDIHAARIARVLLRMGVRLPEDVSIVAIGDHGEGYNSPASLTAVDTRYDDMCRIGLQALRQQVESGKALGLQQRILEPVLRERGSVAGLV